MANRNYTSGGKIYSMHTMPVLLDCSFTVDSTNTNGLGISSLKGPTISAVYMHTTQTPATGSPNPVAGTIMVRLQDNFNQVLSVTNSRIVAPSGSDVKIDNSAMTAGTAYIITTLGNATAAKWRAIGVPAGVTPAVGVSFVALTNGGAGNTLTSRVQTAAATGSAVASIEIVGNPTLSVAPTPSANQGYGAQIILQCRDYAGAIVAPADGSVISLQMYLSNSSVTVQGS